MEETPKIPVEGEVMPSEILKRGEMRTIGAEINHIQAVYESHVAWDKDHGGWTKEPRDEISRLKAAEGEGYTHILRLPRVNEEGCVRKYGGYYDKLSKYFKFIDTLAERSGIKNCKSLVSSYYVFESAEDAEILRDKLIEHQERAEFEFEAIEGDYEGAEN